MPLVSDIQWQREGLKLDALRTVDPRGGRIRGAEMTLLVEDKSSLATTSLKGVEVAGGDA